MLLGYLKISSSGRLQLVDATGEIDVALSNLPSNWHCNKMIEIKDFNITMEIPNDNWNQKPLRDELFTCQSVFSTSPPMKDINRTSYLTCTYNNLEVVNPGSTSAVKCIGNFQVFDGGTFHLLWLMHKFPIINVFQGEQVDSNKMSVFAEAVVLPWVLLSEKDNDAHLHLHSCDRLKKTHAYVVPADKEIGRNENSESVTLKKCNIHKLMRKHANANSTYAKGGDFSSGFLHTYSCSCGIQNSFESRCPFQIPCKITGKSVINNYTGLLKCRDFKEKTPGSCSMLARTVLLEFNQESLSEYQALKVHNYYMLKDCQQDLSSFKEGIKLLISSGMHFWSCSISCPEIRQESNSVSSVQSCHSNVKKNEELNKIDTYSDINISIPCSKNYDKFDSEVSSSIGRPSLLLEGGVEKHNCKRARISTSCPSPEISYHDQVLPEGHLTSLHGLVISVHDTNESYFPAQAAHPCARPHPILLQGKSSICIHVVTDNRNVKISGRSYKGAFPAGIERGVRATFHRILELNGRNDYMLIPASFVEIDSSTPLKNKFGDGDCYTSPEAAPLVPNSEILVTENQPLQLHCRVLAVYVLVLEKTIKSISCDPESFVDIILAGFVLDSGTSSYCCWANHETAAVLLKLRVEKCEFKSCNANASKQSRKKEACGSTIQRLHKILQKYGRIVVKNDGPVHDSLCHDLTISVSSEKIISHSDENILRCLILNSCFSTVQTVVGNVMDDNSTKQLEKYVAEYQMNIPPLQNIWATGVHQMDPLSEARNIFQGLASTN
ncbi:hypothetical protein Leryth_024624 [Lithospermum erythrorhizon]|nr:hypothetical protein Leryth_024624 [Lithospermum erythrorhizon]